MLQSNYHQPALLNDSVNYLVTTKDGIYFDGTLGGGGYTEEILKRLTSKGLIIATDLDINAVNYCHQKFINDKRVLLFKNNFREIDSVLSELNINKIDGVVIDLGVSSYQLDNHESGFSYRFNTEFDLRFDKSFGLPASEIINKYSKKELEEIIRDFGEERFYKKIAFELKKLNNKDIIKTYDIVEAISKITRKDKINETLSRVFQAFRIFVNDELENLKDFLKKSIKLINSGGRIVVVSYHSLEDRIVKEFFNYEALSCICPKDFPVCRCNKKSVLSKITRKVIVAGQEEITNNVRSRSAKLRVAEIL